MRSYVTRRRLNLQVAAIFLTVLVVRVGADYGPPLVGCPIKGNISADGQHIYHVPGQEYYGATSINWLAGERWFCSEQAARDAGWRKSRV